MRTFSVGMSVRLTGKFTNAAGAATNPTTVTLRVRDPDGLITVYTSGFTNPVVGEHYRDIDPTKAGTWAYRFEGTGAVVSVAEQQFRVRRRLVPDV